MCFYDNDACVCMCVMRVCLQMMCVMCEYDIVLHVLLLYIYIILYDVCFCGCHMYCAGCGFLIRLCYVTNDGLHMKTQFIEELNHSYKQGNLLCNFTEKEVTDFFQYKKVDTCEVKRLALFPGRQPDGTWALDGETYISARGDELSPNGVQYLWIQHLVAESVQGIGCEAFHVQKPLSSAPLRTMIMSLIECMEHNACAALLALAAGALTLNYETVREVLNNFPVPVLYGEPGTGKTTALRCVMAALGAPDHIYSKVTSASIRTTLSQSSVPVGIDDPSSKKDAEEIVVQLYNGEAAHTVTHGMQKPRAGIVMTTNFPLDSTARCVSHLPITFTECKQECWT